MWGKHWSDEAKRHNSESHRGEKAFWYGKRMAKETTDKMSIARTGEGNARFDTKLPGASSQYQGVYFDITRNRWKVYVVVDKRRVYIFMCKDEVLAAKAYDKYIVSHGLDRKLNFPEDYN